MLNSISEMTKGQTILTSERSLHVNGEDKFHSKRSKLPGRESVSTIGRMQVIRNQSLEPGEIKSS